MDTLVVEGCTKPLNISKSNCEQESNTKIVNSDLVDISYSKVKSDEKIDQVSDFADDCLQFISEILMEDDLDDQTASLSDYIALQATEKSLYDALGEGCPSSSHEFPSLLGQNDRRNYMISASDCLESELNSDETALFCWSENERRGTSRGRKNLTRNDIDYEEERKSKHSATYTEEYVKMEQYDDVLLFKEDDGESRYSKESTKKKTSVLKKKEHGLEVVGLMSLLTQCAQAVGSFDLRNTNELLKKIRCHFSQYGDNTQRVAYYFSNALEARLAGTGWQPCKNYTTQRIPSSEVLKAYREQVSAIPFRRASYFVANDAIAKLTATTTKIHIVDFVVFFGFQWPGLIQQLSKRRPMGLPMLRITGIDYPESGFAQHKGSKTQGTDKRVMYPPRVHPC